MKIMQAFLKTFSNKIKSEFYEICSCFVLKKATYKIIGNCKRCGECCRRMYSFDTYDERDFDLMKKFFPNYRRFEILDKDEFGNFRFKCNLIGDDGLCTDYNNRLKMCRKYPFYKVKPGVELPEYCGFKIVPEKSFEEFLK